MIRICECLLMMSTVLSGWGYMYFGQLEMTCAVYIHP
jgi:hypothetical protein